MVIDGDQGLDRTAVPGRKLTRHARGFHAVSRPVHRQQNLLEHPQSPFQHVALKYTRVEGLEAL